MLESTWNQTHLILEATKPLRAALVSAGGVGGIPSKKKKKQKRAIVLRWLTATQKNPGCFLSHHLCELIKAQQTIYDKRVERERDSLQPGAEKWAFYSPFADDWKRPHMLDSRMANPSW